MASSGSSFLPLNNGVRIADFHSSGITPDMIISLKSFVIELIRLGEYCLRTFVEACVLGGEYDFYNFDFNPTDDILNSFRNKKNRFLSWE